MSKEEIDFDKLEKELLEIYDSTKRPNKALEKKIKEIISHD